MNKEKIIEILIKNDIHPYGSADLLKFEQNMTRYFEREYSRWDGNTLHPEDYGVSSFEGEISTHESNAETVQHYNDPIDIYLAFLDNDYLAYTMAYFGATNDNTKIETCSLRNAQIHKFELIIERADIQDGQNVFELGCGFGGFSKYLLNKFPNITVTALNPSITQVNHILSDFPILNDHSGHGRFKLINKFIGELSKNDYEIESYDCVVSIGLMESIKNLDKFFLFIASALKVGGKSLHHSIVSMDSIPQLLQADNTMISEYYPGGHVWPHQEPMRHNTHLKPLRSWYINGLNYWKTLDEWHLNFWQNIDKLYPAIIDINRAEHWNKYFVLCKSMFRPHSGKKYGNGHYLHTKV